MSWIDMFKKHSGINDLAIAIVDTSYKCGQEFKEPIDKKFGKDSKEAMLNWVKVQYEFLFFFCHLAMRSALSQLGNDKRTKLQKLIGPILSTSTTEAWVGHWPEDLKERIKTDFFNNINVAELDYSECKGGLLVKDQPFSKDGLFSRLAINIAQLSGYENNPGIILQCESVAVKNFGEMKLDKLINAVGKEI